ncbi:MAG: hypothetical protein J0J04_08590 [Microbacterium sp.]|uniref:hypothetical protein n=1 Tax=Microbacterium sp. TaxID=51671 RepID=UPI001ACB9F47|nr:hypothetical protein [Microbacterium sp.]MBN9214834.1 hypothetical protein [Microbacterium sp.]
MATTNERDILEAIKLARGQEEYGPVAEAMATLELGRQQRAANMVALATALHGLGPTEYESALIRNLLHAAAEVVGMRPDGTIIV